MLVAVLQLFGIAPRAMRSADFDHHPDTNFINVASADWKRRLPLWQHYTNQERFASTVGHAETQKLPQSLLIGDM